MALKKCYKLHKLFLSEVERCDRIDKEGSQVLSSLANVAKRVPLLTAYASASASVGVLGFSADTPALLLERHFAAMEKSAGFLRDIVRDFHDATRRLRGFVDEFADLADDALLKEDEGVAVRGVLQMLEWMENVRTMYTRDALRKRLLVADFEYQDVARLQRMHREWPANASVSFVDVSYVRMGTEMLPPLPETDDDAGDDHVKSETSAASQAKKKKKKKKAAKPTQ